MMMKRRDFVGMMAAGMTAALAPRPAASAREGLGIPGPYRGRVVSVQNPNSIVSGRYQAEPVRDMIRKGITELTGAPNWIEAWRVLFEPGDVVGIKLNPVGQPHSISAPEVFRELVEGLKQAGVKPADIVAYDRYKDQFQEAGFVKWLPEGVRWASASETYLQVQLDMDGYDRDNYMEMALVLPQLNAADRHHRRSYVAKFLTNQVNKLINLAVLKHHQSAGVTLALKNMSHGLVNNVNRSHSTNSLNACGIFIPAVVDLPVIRQKAVLHIVDGIKGAYHGGPGGRIGRYLWEHKTMYFATDPVAVDAVGWKVIDEMRAEKGMLPVATANADRDSNFVNMQPEHIEIAGALGLGEFDMKKIDWRKL